MAQPQIIDSEIEIIQQAAEGSDSAFQLLFHRHFKSVYNYVMWLCQDPSLAEDLTQETFTRAYESIHKFGPPWKFRSWLFRLARNEFYDDTKKTNRNLPLDPELPVEVGDPSPEQQTIMTEIQARVRQTIGSLPAGYREILLLREFDRLSYEEIAQVMDISMANVRALLHRARARFKQHYSANLLVEDVKQRCDELNELLDALHDGGPLSDAEHKRIEKHLKSCPTCQQRRRELIVLRDLIAALPMYDPAMSELSNTTSPPSSNPDQKKFPDWVKKALPLGILVAVVSVAIWSYMFYSGNGWTWNQNQLNSFINPDAVCGDKVCDPSVESISNCPIDCLMDAGPVSSPDCDDDDCVTPAEQDVKSTCVCGDKICDPACENTDLCPADCSCQDDGICQPGEGTNCKDCSTDPAAQCGVTCDGACGNGLTCSNGVCWDACICGGQCGDNSQPDNGSACVCGNGVCQPGCGELRSNCPADCRP